MSIRNNHPRPCFRYSTCTSSRPSDETIFSISSSTRPGNAVIFALQQKKRPNGRFRRSTSKARESYHLLRDADNTLHLVPIPLRLRDGELREELDELASGAVRTLVRLSQKLDLRVGLIRRDGEALGRLPGVVRPLPEPAAAVEGEADVAVVEGGEGV